MPVLAQLTAAEYDAIMRRAPAIIVPVGAVEWHDAHLPLGFDFQKVEALAKLIAAEVGCLVAPPIAFGYPRHFSKDPVRSLGTICPDFDALSNYVLSLGVVLVDKGFKVIYFLSGHYERSQIGMLKVICRRLEDYARESGQDVRTYAHHEPDFTIRAGISQNAREDYVRTKLGLEYRNGDHAGFYETSLALHLFPELVRWGDISTQHYDNARGGAPTAEWGAKWTAMIVQKASEEIRAGLLGQDLVIEEE